MSIFHYLQTIEARDLDSLYTNKWACKSVFRSLTELSKQYIMQYLWSTDPIQILRLSNNLQNNIQAIEFHTKSMEDMVSLRILL
jgi:hypothetical protein